MQIVIYNFMDANLGLEQRVLLHCILVVQSSHVILACLAVLSGYVGFVDAMTLSGHRAAGKRSILLILA